jgi:hypothetical protein
MTEATICRRWIVAFDHDGSPVDGCIFISKPAADAAVKSMKRPEKYRVRRVCILSDEVVDNLLRQDGNS